MKTVLALSFALLSSTAAAQTVSPDACRILAESASRASETIAAATDRMHLDEALLPHLPPDAASAMKRVLAAEVEAKAKVLAYTAALKDFADAMKACGQ